MKKLITVIMAIIMLASAMAITASAAMTPVTPGKAMTPSDFEPRSIRYYQDYAEKAFYDCPKVIMNRTLQSNGTLTNKYEYNIITRESEAFTDNHEVFMTGAYLTIDNIIQETTRGVYSLLFTKGETTINVHTGPEDYANAITITKFDQYEVARGNLLYLNGYKQYSTEVVWRVNDGGPGHEPQNFTYNLKEHGLYMVTIGTTPVPFGAAIGSYTFMVCITDGTEDLNENVAKTVSATGSTAKIDVNGKYYDCPSYVINGNNYIRVRDVAYILNGTNKQFNIAFAKANYKRSSIVTLLTYNNPAYVSTGVELTPVRTGTVTAQISTQAFENMGSVIHPLAYVVDGNNYVMLREIGKILNFGVDYRNGTVYLDTSIGYTD